jgi:hypothetical protein
VTCAYEGLSLRLGPQRGAADAGAA